MPVDWDKLGSEIDDIIRETEDSTDEKLAARISSITRMTDEEIQELFPLSGDIKKLFDLMKIVESADDRNTKIKNIVNNAEKFGGVILTLLKKFA